jgi:hypothetical protein
MEVLQQNMALSENLLNPVSNFFSKGFSKQIIYSVHQIRTMITNDKIKDDKRGGPWSMHGETKDEYTTLIRKTEWKRSLGDLGIEIMLK